MPDAGGLACHAPGDEGAASGGEVRWVRPRGEEARAELAPWCNGVGPPLLHRPAGAELDDDGPAPADGRIAVVSWNVGVGAGDLGRLLDDLREGRLTGRRPAHFVLLLQEAFSRRDPVPGAAGQEVRGADRIGTPSSTRARSEIGALARERGLHLLYVPSMRNGSAGDGAPAEDRGNAILSTLPLSAAQAVELPLQAQRRVAVAATVRAPGPDGRPRSLRVASVHLDHHGGWKGLHRSFGEGRARHAALLVETLGAEELIVVGGDFNTWFGEEGEPAVELMRAHLPLPASPPDGNTLEVSLLPDRLVDHLFFRTPDGWAANYRIAPASYGSDHRPLVGWLEPAATVAGPAAGGVG